MQPAIRIPRSVRAFLRFPVQRLLERPCGTPFLVLIEHDQNTDQTHHQNMVKYGEIQGMVETVLRTLEGKLY